MPDPLYGSCLDWGFAVRIDLILTNYVYKRRYIYIYMVVYK